MESQLVTLVNASGLEKQEGETLIEKFNSFEQVAKEWETKAKTIVVEREDQTTEMAMAKEARKKFSQMRIEIEKSRKTLKEQSLRKGQAIDSIAKYLKSLIEPIEQYLKEQECFLEIKAEREAEKARLELEAQEEKERVELEKKQQKLQERQIQLAFYAKFTDAVITLDTSDQEFLKILNDAKLAEKKHEAEQKKISQDLERMRVEAEKKERQRLKIEAEQKAKLDAERLKREKIEAELRAKEEEEERVRIENEARLKSEAEAKSKAEKNKKYLDWLKQNNFDKSKMRVERDGDVFTMWQKVAEIVIGDENEN